MLAGIDGPGYFPARRMTRGQSVARSTDTQLAWLRRGLSEPGGKLPLFDPDGRAIDARTVQACLKAGWAEPWRHNPIKPDWLVCRLTEAGRQIAIAENIEISS